MNITKFRTRPCRNYHGPNGCMRGDNCHFIHDTNYAGQDIPNFNLANYKKDDEDEKKPMPFMMRPPMPMMPMNPMNPMNQMNPMNTMNPMNPMTQPGMRPPYGYMPPNFPFYMNPGFIRPPVNNNTNEDNNK
jgi:hypothetical protein